MKRMGLAVALLGVAACAGAEGSKFDVIGEVTRAGEIHKHKEGEATHRRPVFHEAKVVSCAR